MAILIDMDMPESCLSCIFHDSPEFDLFCELTNRYVADWNDMEWPKPDWCPLREVVKCKDCKHWGQDGYKEGCKYMMCIVTENDWCSFAERREE